jgi:hypothetical protein
MTDPSMELHELCGTIFGIFGGLLAAEVPRAADEGNDSVSEKEKSVCHIEAFGHFSALEGDSPASRQQATP